MVDKPISRWSFNKWRDLNLALPTGLLFLLTIYVVIRPKIFNAVLLGIVFILWLLLDG